LLILLALIEGAIGFALNLLLHIQSLALLRLVETRLGLVPEQTGAIYRGLPVIVAFSFASLFITAITIVAVLTTLSRGGLKGPWVVSVVIGVVLAAPIAFDVLCLHLSVGDFFPWLTNLADANDRL
jgi:hypothetical protein